jgi:hypothetical protein
VPHRDAGRRSFRVQLRPEARAAAFMLATVHRKGEDSPYKQGLRFWVRDAVDALACNAFQATFGISVKEFLQRVRARVPRSRRGKYIPADASLERSAQRLLARQFELARRAGRVGGEAR